MIRNRRCCDQWLIAAWYSCCTQPRVTDSRERSTIIDRLSSMAAGKAWAMTPPGGRFQASYQTGIPAVSRSHLASPSAIDASTCA